MEAEAPDLIGWHPERALPELSQQGCLLVAMRQSTTTAWAGEGNPVSGSTLSN